MILGSLQCCLCIIEAEPQLSESAADAVRQAKQSVSSCIEARDAASSSLWLQRQSDTQLSDSQVCASYLARNSDDNGYYMMTMNPLCTDCNKTLQQGERSINETVTTCVITEVVGSRALSFSGPLLSLSVEFCGFVCLFVCLWVRNFEVKYLGNERS